MKYKKHESGMGKRMREAQEVSVKKSEKKQTKGTNNQTVLVIRIPVMTLMTRGP
jgi:hypothetical protein